jgi:hypothetical protein
MNVVSKSGSVVVSGAITGNGGAMTIGAGADVNVAHSITNAGTLSPLTITAGSDINVNAAIDGRTAANGPSSAVTLTAGQNVNLNQSINTQDAAISVTAAQGTVTDRRQPGTVRRIWRHPRRIGPDTLDRDYVHDRCADAALDERIGQRQHADQRRDRRRHDRGCQ